MLVTPLFNDATSTEVAKTDAPRLVGMVSAIDATLES